MEGYQLGGGRGRTSEEVQGIRGTNWWVENRQMEVKNSIGNGETKELICTTHGHELRGGIAGGIAEYWVDRGKGRKIGATVIP